MPRVSQVGIPVQQAAQTPIGVDLGPGGQGLQALGQGVGQVGQVMAAQEEQERKVQELLERKRVETADTLGKARSMSLRKQGISEIDIFKETHPDPTEWEKGVGDIAKSIAKKQNELEMSPEARKIADTQLELWADEQAILARSAGVVRAKDDALDATKANFIDALEGGDPEDIFEARLYLFEILNNTVDAAERDNTIKELEEFGHEKRVERITDNIKPTLVDFAETEGKDSAIEALDTITQQLVDEGQWTEVEAVQSNKILGDWLDNYVAGRKKQADDAVKLTTHETYMDMSGPIIEGKLTYDDIEKSSLLKADKQKWQQYIKGSYQSAPKDNTPEGHNVAFNAVYDAATLQLSPTEAYDVLLEARFNDKTITDSQFEWGVDKIENPYPPVILEDMKSTMKFNQTYFHGMFNSKADKEQSKKVNESLVSWVDTLIAKDQVPLFDLKKKMNAMSSQFRAGEVVPWYDIGQIVERNGTEWEVIGFDSDGEPLVEQVAAPNPATISAGDIE